MSNIFLDIIKCMASYAEDRVQHTVDVTKKCVQVARQTHEALSQLKNKQQPPQSHDDAP